VHLLVGLWDDRSRNVELRKIWFWKATTMEWLKGRWYGVGDLLGCREGTPRVLLVSETLQPENIEYWHRLGGSKLNRTFCSRSKKKKSESITKVPQSGQYSPITILIYSLWSTRNAFNLIMFFFAIIKKWNCLFISQCYGWRFFSSFLSKAESKTINCTCWIKRSWRREKNKDGY
jgi:hypothetical protein